MRVPWPFSFKKEGGERGVTGKVLRQGHILLHHAMVLSTNKPNE